MIQKVLKSIFDGSFSEKVKYRTSYLAKMKNANAQMTEAQYACLLDLEKEFGPFVDAYKVEPAERKKSDYIWICWFQGEDAAPPLVKRCIQSMRDAMPNKQIVVLSDQNIPDYLELPDYMVQKKKDGKYGLAHYSDILRVELLCKYGGMWVDATVLCTAKEEPAYMKESDLFLYKKMDLNRRSEEPIVASSWLISACSNHEILLLTRDLLREYWKTHETLADYFLFHLFFTMATKKYKELWDSVPFYNNNSPHTLQFELNSDFSEKRWNEICRFSDFHKLNHHIQFNDNGKTFYSKVLGNEDN